MSFRAVSDRSFYCFGVAILAFAGGIQAFFLSRGFYSIGWDEAGRTLDAYSWAAHGKGNNSAWLPFYRVFVGLWLRVFPDLVITPRVVTFVFGLVSILACGWLAQELFQDRLTSMTTLWFSLFFSQRIALSLAPLSSEIFTAIVLVTVAAFARWLRTDKMSALWISAGACALAGTVRFEGWFFGAAIFLLITSRHFLAPDSVERNVLLPLFCILFAFPAVWGASSWVTSDMMQSVTTHYALADVVRRNPLAEFLITNAYSLNLLGMAAVVQSIRKEETHHRSILAVSFLPLICISLILLALHTAQTGPSWRMIDVWGMLLLPFTARLCFAFRGAGLLIGCALLASFMHDTLRIERESRWAFTESDRLAGQYLNRLLLSEPDSKILIESSTFAFLNIEVASQHPDAFVNNSTPERAGTPVLPIGTPVWRTGLQPSVRYLMFRTNPYKEALNWSPEVYPLKVFGDWSIYRRAD
jgi:hypothetical protein